VKGVVYIVNGMDIFQGLFLDNILVIIVVIAFFWIATMATCSIVCYLVEYIQKCNEQLENKKNKFEKEPLTGLNNRATFTKLFSKIIENTARRKEPISVLVIDIDFFKKVNDIYGNLAGDSILKSLAYILRGACNKLDILGRIEGDKFSIVLYKSSNDEAVKMAERIRAVIEKYPFVLPQGKTIYITVSIGVATYPDTTEKPEDIFSQADKALHYAKQTGKNKVCSI